MYSFSSKVSICSFKNGQIKLIEPFELMELIDFELDYLWKKTSSTMDVDALVTPRSMFFSIRCVIF